MTSALLFSLPLKGGGSFVSSVFSFAAKLSEMMEQVELTVLQYKVLVTCCLFPCVVAPILRICVDSWWGGGVDRVMCLFF